jgi:hypothetical protein
VEFPLSIGSCDIEIYFPTLKKKVSFIGLTPILAVVLLAFNLNVSASHLQSGLDDNKDCPSFLSTIALRMLVLGHAERNDHSDAIFTKVFNFFNFITHLF